VRERVCYRSALRTLRRRDLMFIRRRPSRNCRPAATSQLGSTDSVLRAPRRAISGLDFVPDSGSDSGSDSSVVSTPYGGVGSLGAPWTCRLHREVKSATRRNRSPSSSRRERVIITKNTPTTMTTATATATMIGVTSGSFRPAGTYPYLIAERLSLQLRTLKSGPGGASRSSVSLSRSWVQICGMVAAAAAPSPRRSAAPCSPQ
jgi:hypothetical protein